jgi:cell division protein FtsA
MSKVASHLAALDIGTSEVRAVVGELSESEKLEIVGVGRAPSRGVRKGVVVNIEAAVEAVKRAVEDAEAMSGLPIDQAYVGLGGAQLRGMNSRGVIAISRRNRDITEEDVYRVIDQARAISVPTDREIIDVLPQEFTVDGQDGIGNPIGFLGMRLEAAVHVVTSPITARQNVITAVNRAGVMVTDTVVNHVSGA